MKLVNPKEVAVADVIGGVPIDTNKFKAGDNVVIANYKSRVMKVVGNAVDPRTGEKRVVMIWYNNDGTLCEAGLHQDLLELAGDNA